MRSGEWPDWQALTALVCQALGWTWDEVLEQMDLPRYKALCRHWEEAPPVHLTVAAYFFGDKAKKAGGSGGPGVTRPIEPSQTAGAILDALILPEAERVAVADSAWLDKRPLQAARANPQSAGAILDSLVRPDGAT